MADYKNQIEALLFSSGRFMEAETLVNLIGASGKGVIVSNINKLKEEYEARDSPLMIVEENDSWKINVRERYLPLVRRIVAELELPKTVLETLAVIAWKAPVLQSDVIDIRHNKAYEHIDQLEQLGFVIKEKMGRSYQLKLSSKFFDYFEVDGNKGIREIFKDMKKPQEEQPPAGEISVPIAPISSVAPVQQESALETVQKEPVPPAEEKVAEPADSVEPKDPLDEKQEENFQPGLDD